MRTGAICLLLAAIPAAAMAQPGADTAQRYATAPWWMGKPVMASSGYVKEELPSNRAQFQAGFKVLDASPQTATRKAADKVRALVQQLASAGPGKVRVVTSISVRPIYEQYKDKDGRLISNQRSDKIDTYEATADLSIEVRDMAQLEKAYALVLAAGPASTGAFNFDLEPSNEVNTRLFADAVGDAVRRAKLSAEATGARLGPIKLIDPTGRACETEVLVSGAQNTEDDTLPFNIQPRAPAPAVDVEPPPPPMAPSPAEKSGNATDVRVESMRLAVQPPLRSLTAKACVVFALN